MRRFLVPFGAGFAVLTLLSIRAAVPEPTVETTLRDGLARGREVAPPAFPEGPWLCGSEDDQAGYDWQETDFPTVRASIRALNRAAFGYEEVLAAATLGPYLESLRDLAAAEQANPSWVPPMLLGWSYLGGIVHHDANVMVVEQPTEARAAYETARQRAPDEGWVRLLGLAVAVAGDDAPGWHEGVAEVAAAGEWSWIDRELHVGMDGLRTRIGRRDDVVLAKRLAFVSAGTNPYFLQGMARRSIQEEGLAVEERRRRAEVFHQVGAALTRAGSSNAAVGHSISKITANTLLEGGWAEDASRWEARMRAAQWGLFDWRLACTEGRESWHHERLRFLEGELEAGRMSAEEYERRAAPQRRRLSQDYTQIRRD